MSPDNKSSLKEIFIYFLKLGAAGFGGPFALIGQMQIDLVENRKWVSLAEFNQAFTFIKMMPGPVAFSTAVYLGRHRSGRWGGLIAGSALLLPAFILMIVMALAYNQLNQFEEVKKIFHGMQIAAMVLIIGAFWNLIKVYKTEAIFWIMLVTCVALIYFKDPLEPLLILAFGVLGVLSKWRPTAKLNSVTVELFAICFYAGAFVFGTGLAIVPLLEKDFVHRLGWLTQNEFLDALAFGQLTPGPVTITVTFIGFKVAGLAGALLATVGVFMPSAIHMLTWFPSALKWLRRQSWIEGFFKGAMAAIAATIIFACYKITSNWQPLELVVVLVLLAVTLRWKIPGHYLILSGAVIGLFF